MSVEATGSNKKQKIAVISKDLKFRARTDFLERLFNAEIHFFETADLFAESDKLAAEMEFVILSAVESESQGDTAGMIQTVKFMAPKSPIAVIVEKKIKTEDAVFFKKSGASVVLLEDEYLYNSKIEFFVARYLHGEWVVIKSYELIANTPLPFAIYHLMPLNQRLLAVVQKGQELTKEKLEKFNTVGEFYIHRDQINDYVKFLEGHNDKSAAGLKRRCRAVFMNFVKTYKDLVILLTDQSEAASYKEGTDLLQKLTTMAAEVINQLGASGEAWEVVNMTSMEDFSPIDRSSAIAAYAGLVSLLGGIGKPEDLMMSALISDLGMLNITPKTIEKIKRNKWTELLPEEQKEYDYHPIASLNMVLSRKLPIPDIIKNIVSTSHENFSQTGFPNQVKPDRIPEESYLLQFCELLDRSALVEFGKPRLNPTEVRQQVLEREMKNNPMNFPPVILKKIKEAFN